MLESDAPVQYDSRLFLARTLARGDETDEISQEKGETIQQDIATLSHKLITVKAEDVSSPSELRKQVQDAFVLTSLGLEHGSHGDLDKAVRLLNNNRVVKFFQIGNTLIDELVERCQNTLEKAVLVSPEPSSLPFLDPEEIPVYNEWEHQFLNEIDDFKLVIDSPQIILRGVSVPRPITTPADLTILGQQLDNIDNRLTYLQALPLDEVFDAEYPPNTDDDTAREITIALMVNLILYREIDFYLDSGELQNFRDIAYDTDSGQLKNDSRDRLISWIGHYLDAAGLPDEVKNYAVAYWRECLKILETDLQQEGDRETSDVLRP